MNWFVWRQYRKQLLLTGAGAVLFALAVSSLGSVTAHAYQQARAAHNANFIITGASRYLVLCGIAAPLLLGLFWGAPLIAKEYEERTNGLVWTQSVTRRAWLTAKLGWLLLAAGAIGGLLSASAWWGLRTENMTWLDRFEWVHFDVQGAMPIVYAVFAVALGAMIGALTKRVLRAIGFTLAIFVTLQLMMAFYVRPHYQPALHYVATTVEYGPKAGGEGTTVANQATGPVPAGAYWNLGEKFSSVLVSCKGLAPNTTDYYCYHNSIASTFQPANRFWTFQAIEAGVYAVLTIGAVGTTYWLVLKRDA